MVSGAERAGDFRGADPQVLPDGQQAQPAHLLCHPHDHERVDRPIRQAYRCGGDGDAADITAIVDGIAIFAGRGDLSVPLRQGGRIVPPQAGKSLVDLSPGIAAESGNAAARGADQRREPASDISTFKRNGELDRASATTTI
jgi:hypothetical protein